MQLGTRWPVGADTPSTLPEIVVTATRTDRAAFDVPASIDAIVADDVDDALGATQLAQRPPPTSDAPR